MRHRPLPIAVGVPPYAIELAECGRDGRLVVYAGAGMSMGEPAGLPPGSMVAAALYERLKVALPHIDGCDTSDLSSIADAVAKEPNGIDALRQTVPKVAEFASARPCYGHQVLALLFLEGVTDVVTTNWDDCVERGAGRERVGAVVTEQDLLDLSTTSILKLHGCVTRPTSLLLTTAELEEPPGWVRDQTRARLEQAVVAFVGIGDVAGYVAKRLQEAVVSAGSVENIRVVDPSIASGWASSPWADLIPGLLEGHRIEATSDVFLEQVGGAYVHLVLADLAARIADEEHLRGAATAATAAIEKHHSLAVLSWARSCAVAARSGVSVLSAEAMHKAMLALGLLLVDFQVSGDGLVMGERATYDVVVATETQSASRLRREVRTRLEHHLSQGKTAPMFLVSGGVGWATNASSGTSIDIIGGGDVEDLIDGPLSADPDILRAEEVVG